MDSPQAQPSLAVIGLDDLGVSIAQNLMNWPGGLRVYDKDGSRYSAIAASDINICATLAEAVDADIVSIVDFAASGIEHLLGDLGRYMRPGAILAIHSTLAEATLVNCAEELLKWGVHLVDAPVSGSPTAALIGELAVMVGASPEVFSTLEAPFSQWASLVVHAGPTGMGLRMKLAESMMTFTRLAAAQEAQRLATAGGVDRDALVELIRDGGLPAPLDSAEVKAMEALSFTSDTDDALARTADEVLDLPLTHQARCSISDDPPTDYVSGIGAELPTGRKSLPRNDSD